MIIIQQKQNDFPLQYKKRIVENNWLVNSSLICLYVQAHHLKYTWIKKRNLSLVRLIVLRILHVHDIRSAAKSQRSIFKQSTLIVNISRRGICVCDDVVGSKEGMNIERTTTPEHRCGKTRKRNIINAFG